jgi:uncharacterized protein with HEPN domain
MERIQDILDAINEIQAFTSGMKYEAFKEDSKTRRAVELDFIIIGEAANRVPVDIQETYPKVPWHLMEAMRNRLVHVYFSVDPRLVWDTIQNDFPTLSATLRAMLSEK